MISAPVPDQFYRAFEDRHRGSRELIKERLRAYLPFVTALSGLYPDLPALPVLDVGCGRGEWLELLLDHRIAAHGVDTDEGMLSACRERGLNVAAAEAIGHLESLASHSLLAVTGFHIAEHLPFDRLQVLFVQARRVIVPGGLLILETPNPENLLVGSANFYIDPTHQRPLPSQLLSFLAEHQEFSPVKVLRLQEESRLAENGVASLYDVLGNVSPDYAVVAQVPLDGGAFNAENDYFVGQLRQAFEGGHGISLLTLANRFDEQLQRKAAEQLAVARVAQSRAEEAMGQVMQADTNVQQLGTDVFHVKKEVQHVATTLQQVAADVQQLDSELRKISAYAHQLRDELTGVYASHSWRTTRPLRWLARVFRTMSGKS